MSDDEELSIIGKAARQQPKEYRWETGYEKTWEAIKENEEGLIDESVLELIEKSKRRRKEEKTKRNRLGMMRHVFILLDCSESMVSPELKPTRFICTLTLLQEFVNEFVDQNPISQIGLIALKNKRAEKLTDLGGNSKVHTKILERLKNVRVHGEISIQNGLVMAYNTLKIMPSHTSREILIIMSSLNTVDPGDIFETMKILKEHKIRVSIISLSAEVFVCRQLADKTGGTYFTILDESHYRDLLLSHIDPPGVVYNKGDILIHVGFPHSKPEKRGKEPLLSMCACHVENRTDPCKLSTDGYFCPKCKTKYCELPAECKVCDLMLISAPHLARSFHNLFPVANFIEVDFDEQTDECYACRKRWQLPADKKIFYCDKCKQYYCYECDSFIHDRLHSCFGCETIPTVKASASKKPNKMHHQFYSIQQYIKDD